MTYNLNNKVVIVTGGANGVGSFVVKYALDEGAKHVAILDVTSNGAEFAQELNQKHGANKVKFYRCDVTDEQVLKIYDQVKSETGYVDVVINNAGIMNDDLHVYKKEIDINFTALVTSTIKALELMRQDEGGKGGTVINIASVAALVQIPVLPIYAATKSAVLQFSNLMGMDAYYTRTNVRVLTVCFGTTDSNLLHRKNVGNFDKVVEEDILVQLGKFPYQRMESAAKGVIDTYKQGASGSTWVVENDQPARDITDNIQNGFAAFRENLFTH